MGEISEKMFNLIKGNGLSEYQAWNECTVQLVNIAKVKIN